MDERVLYVDDDPNLLGMYRIQLEQWFQVTTAEGGEEGLRCLAQQSYAVVISDLHMPGMDGIEFLTAVHGRYPDVIRMMLTAKADLQSAIAAVNRSRIFRLLVKPCTGSDLRLAIEDAIKQFRLVRSERDLLSKTLSGAVKLLTEVLASISPDSYGRVDFIRQLVRQLCKELDPPDPWQIEVAAMLWHVGFVGLSPAVRSKAFNQLPMSAAEARALEAHPKIGAGLLSNIPRLEGVARIVEYQRQSFEPPPGKANVLYGNQLPIGARILKVALDYDSLGCSGLDHDAALAVMKRREGAYDPAALKALVKVTASETPPDSSVLVSNADTSQNALANAVYYQG